MVAGGKLGDVKVGTLYLPLGVLRRLTDEAGKGQQGQAGGANGQDAGRRGPVINMLDTPDCHSLPKEYTAYAKEQDIALWAGGGGEGAGMSIHCDFLSAAARVSTTTDSLY